MADNGPGIDDVVAKPLAAVHRAMTAVHNGVGQDADDNIDGWAEALNAASRLADAAEALAGAIRFEVREREEGS